MERMERLRRVICFGDSNTYGFDPRSALGGRYPKEVRWTGRLEGLGWQVTNLGLNGREIPHRPGEIRDAVGALSSSAGAVVTVMLGGNDLMMNPGFRAEDAAERMEGFLREVLAQPVFRTGEARLLLVVPPPAGKGTWVTEERMETESRRLAGCYRQTAETLDISWTDSGAWEVELVFDGVHFSPLGHERFAQGIACVLEKEAEIAGSGAGALAKRPGI